MKALIKQLPYSVLFSAIFLLAMLVLVLLAAPWQVSLFLVCFLCLARIIHYVIEGRYNETNH